MDHKLDKDYLEQLIVEKTLDHMKRLLVVGGTGFIGYHIIKEAKKKILVTSLSLNRAKKKDFIKV